MKTVVVLGASPNPERYAYQATLQLMKANHHPILVSNKKGELLGLPFLGDIPENISIDTVTVYLNQTRQKAYYSSILKVLPKRVIFNPGAENIEFEILLKNKGIEVLNACTLVMLRLKIF
jgi:predicted CoA-binding protein